MYLQITNRCTMNCVHCGMIGVSSTGAHMELTVFRKALKFAECYDSECLTLGGGEPTEHPNFWEIFGLSIASVESVYVVTNGANKEIALKLAKLNRRHSTDYLVTTDLSRDPFHDDIDWEVINAFRHPHIREVRKVVNAGKLKHLKEGDEFEGYEVMDRCICEGLLIDVWGNVWECGCKLNKLGNVMTGVDHEKLSAAWDNDHQCTKMLRLEQEQAKVQDMVKA